jgi:hypothetical protein
MGKAVSEMDREAEGILGEFEGSPVTKTGIEIRNAAGGLNDALEVDPVTMLKGDTCYVVLRCDVIDVHFPNVKGAEDQCRRVHIMRATDAVIMDTAGVKNAIDAQRKRIIKAREEAKGVQRMFADDDENKGEGEGEGAGSEPSPDAS